MNGGFCIVYRTRVQYEWPNHTELGSSTQSENRKEALLLTQGEVLLTSPSVLFSDLRHGFSPWHILPDFGNRYMKIQNDSKSCQVPFDKTLCSIFLCNLIDNLFYMENYFLHYTENHNLFIIEFYNLYLPTSRHALRNFLWPICLLVLYRVKFVTNCWFPHTLESWLNLVSLSYGKTLWMMSFSSLVTEVSAYCDITYKNATLLLNQVSFLALGPRIYCRVDVIYILTSL